MAEASVLVVDQRHPRASDENAGTSAAPLKTISSAARRAQPGDTVLVKEGIYRERVAPARGGTEALPIVYMAQPGDTVSVRGSDVFLPAWQKSATAARVFTAGLKDLLSPDSYNPYAERMRGFGARKTLGQVFVNGAMLTELETLDQVAARPGSWTALSEGREIAVHFPIHAPPPHQCLVELSVRNRIFCPFTRGLGYIHVKGFTFEHCANQSAGSFWEPRGTQAGALSCRSGHHWLIENNTVRFAKSIGIDCGGEGGADQDGITIPRKQVGYHLIRHNIVSDNGETGINGRGHYETRVVGNIIERNNALGCAAVEEAGIKFHQYFDGVIEGNLIRDNDCRGIWLDAVWYRSRITRNVVFNSVEAGIFVELGGGDCLVDTNFVGFTRCGDGIYAHDTSGITVAHNLLYCNTHFGVYMRTVSEREFDQPEGDGHYMPSTSDNQVLNNVFIDNYRGQICLPLETERDRNNRSDYNLFVSGAQWQWEGLGFNRFCPGCDDGRISPEKIAAALLAAYETDGIAPEKRYNLELWKDSPNLTLDEWRMVTGWDRNSSAPLVHRGDVENGAIVKGSCNCSAAGLFVEFKNLPTFNQLTCPPAARVTRDLFGKELTGERVLPGPFQSLGDRHVVLPLWPLPETC